MLTKTTPGNPVVDLEYQKTLYALGLPVDVERLLDINAELAEALEAEREALRDGIVAAAQAAASVGKTLKAVHALHKVAAKKTVEPNALMIARDNAVALAEESDALIEEVLVELRFTGVDEHESD